MIFTEREELEETAIHMEGSRNSSPTMNCSKLFQKLPQQFAEVVMLADVQEFPYREIQETLGIPAGTVMSRLSRGRQLLRVHLAECAGPESSAAPASNTRGGILFPSRKCGTIPPAWRLHVCRPKSTLEPN
jgi:hypothetical protein